MIGVECGGGVADWVGSIVGCGVGDGEGENVGVGVGTGVRRTMELFSMSKGSMSG